MNVADFVLTSCSTTDLSHEYFEKRNIGVKYFHFELGGTDYLDDMGKSVPPKELFDRMLAGEDTKTSQITMGEYTEFFEPYLESGKDILHIAFSSGLSGSYNSARLAAEELSAKYPDRKLYVIDSLAASTGHGLVLDKAADLRDEGKSIDEIRDWIEANKNRAQHWFFSSDLTFFIRGGRVSKTAGAIGTVLGICPLLNVNDEGKLIAREKVRGKKRVIKRIVEVMEEHAENGLDYSGKVFISNSDCYEDARAVADLIEEKFTKMNGKVEIYSIGATIGSHTGPGTVALFFWGDERTR